MVEPSATGLDSDDVEQTLYEHALDYALRAEIGSDRYDELKAAALQAARSNSTARASNMRSRMLTRWSKVLPQVTTCATKQTAKLPPSC